MRRISLALMSALFVMGVAPAMSWAQEQVNGAIGAQEESARWTPALGARVGGYGFRHLNAQEKLAFDNCRMDGVGVFGTLDLSRHIFTELSLDLYHATGPTMRSGIDRISLHTVGAVGLRMAPDRLISPFVQLGGGAEYTWVEVFGRGDGRFLPVGFVGLGGELNLDRFKLGLTMRSNAMQLPEYEWAKSGEADSITYKTEVAGQLLFSVRYTM